MAVLELTLTVVWPVWGSCTSSVLPETLAIIPDAAGRNAAGGPPEPLPEPLELPPPEPAACSPVATGLTAALVAAGLFDCALAAALPPPPPHAAATSDTTARVPTARARRRPLATGTSRLFTGFLPPVLLCYAWVVTRSGALRWGPGGPLGTPGRRRRPRR